MIRFQRTGTPRFGKTPQAVKWAKALAGHIARTYAVPVQVFTESDGTVHWMIDYPDYQAYGRETTTAASEPWTLNLVGSLTYHVNPSSATLHSRPVITAPSQTSRMRTDVLGKNQ